MQTTITIDDDLLRIAEQMAAEQSMPVDKVVSGLIRKGLENTRPVLTEGAHGFPVFRAPPRAKTVTLEDVRRAEDEQT